MPTEISQIPRVPAGQVPTRSALVELLAPRPPSGTQFTALYRQAAVRLLSGDDQGAPFLLEFPINPEKATVNAPVSHAEHAPLGYSQTVLQYAGSGALTISFPIVYDRLIARGTLGEEGTRNLLYSLTKPVAAGRGPRRVRLLWPGWLFSAGVLRDGLQLEITRWLADGRPRAWTANVTFVEQHRMFLPAAVAQRTGMLAWSRE